MKVLIPFTPHLAYECLEKLEEKNIDKWPEINKKLISKQKIKIAVQINGKTREIIKIDENLSEKDVVIESKKNDKIKKNLKEKQIIKIIYVKNKIINYLIK